jgi:hypothetical protein
MSLRVMDLKLGKVGSTGANRQAQQRRTTRFPISSTVNINKPAYQGNFT